ncbi:MAG: hypothetical protein M3270_05165, partial [Thermoproteota archaeon]|nr:hypothetical protein [Thermoproteota archaeon]
MGSYKNNSSPENSQTGSLLIRDSSIYTDFISNINWMKKVLRSEIEELAPNLLPLAKYYLNKRLNILDTGKTVADPRYGRPMPFLALWFSNSLGIKKKNDANKFALALTYANLFFCIRDDLIDGRVLLSRKKLASEHEHIALSNFYYIKYFNIFEEFFPKSSTIWYILADSFRGWWENEYWSLGLREVNYHFRNSDFLPLSKRFLSKSSQYLISITFPTIAGLTILSGNVKLLPQMRNFLSNYFIGFRISDDLRDWRQDLHVKGYNCSSVIYHALSLRRDLKRMTSVSMNSAFFDRRFVMPLYTTMLKYYRVAKKDATQFNTLYLKKFMDDQIDYYIEERDFLLNRNISLKNFLIDFFKVMPTATASAKDSLNASMSIYN